jgi:TolB protein
MKKENLVKRLRKKILPCILASTLVCSSLFNYRCTGEFVESELEKPVAMLTANPTEGDAPLDVSFDGSMSYAREGSLEYFHWDFDGDGNTDTTSDHPYISHIYQNSGNYNARLVVEDSQGQKSDNNALENIVVNEDIVSLGQIAFWRNIDGNEDIYLGDIIGGNLENITRLTTHPNQDLVPAWSPDGEYLSWVTNRDGNTSIYIIKEDGTNLRKLTPLVNTDFLSPSWSPDGTEIAFAFVDRDLGTNGIAKMNSDGSELIIKIFENSGIGSAPEGIHWSKDGRIFYNDIIEGNSEIFSVNPDDGSDKTRITNTFHNEALPDISPNGDRLVFVSDQFGGEFSGLEIMSMAIDGTDVRRITNTYEMEVDPKYSNEGTKLLYSRWNSAINTWQMYLSNPDGTVEIPLFVDGRYSAWRPEID